MARGTITYVNREKGYGFIDGEQGDVFFHATKLRGYPFASLVVGEDVDYTDQPGERTRVATTVTPLEERRIVAADILFVKVMPGVGKAPQRVEFPANSIFEADDGSRFQVAEAIRQGGNGVVFKAMRLTGSGSVDRVCAVKLLKHLDPQRIDRFSNEVRVLRGLSHDHISPFYATGSLALDGLTLPWIAIELGGDNLRNYVDNEGPVKIPVLKRIATQMCHALQHLHQCHFIHRDIKPDNFVWAVGNPTDIMMIDFGLAKRLEENISGRPLDGFTKHLEFVGPVFFSSPELIAYARDKSRLVDHRSDIFQLGKVIWFLATGDISAGIPARRKDPTGGPLHALMIDMLQDDPDDRIPTTCMVAERLSGV